MAPCNCSKKRRKPHTAYAGRASQSEPNKRPEVNDEKSTKVQFPDGEVREYATRLEAHAAKIIAGGGKFIE